MAALFALLWLINAGTRATLEQARADHAKTLQQIDRIERLKAEWENNPAARGRIESLLAEERFKKLEGKVVKSGAQIKAEISGLDAALINALTRQLLQAPVPVKTLQLRRQGDQAVDMALEVGL